MSELDERKAAILKAVVEEYVQTGVPVGSQTIARSGALNVSSATVRNEMTVLEREGYIAQPHTSAGRVPTDRGYRYFVDHLAGHGQLPPTQRRAVAEFFTSAHRALEDLLHETSGLLSRVSHHASLVSGPQPEGAVVRSVQVVSLHDTTALVIAVLSSGVVEKQVLPLDDAADQDRLAAVAAALGAQLVGHPWGTLPDVRPTGDPALDRLVEQASVALRSVRADEHLEPLYVGGTSRIAAEQEAFATAESAARLLEMLEHQVVVVSLVRELLEQGLSVSIGAENPLAELRDCAIVLSPYQVEGRLAGVVGVLGPTRMDYRHALAAVSAVSEQLNRHLS